MALSGEAVFSFDRWQEADIRSHSVAQVNRLVDRIKTGNLEVVSIILTGHADRLNGTGQADYNQRLSERRVQTVRDLLIKLGVDAKLITTDARGDRQQIEPCTSGPLAAADLRECLLPNRRVTIEISARARP